MSESFTKCCVKCGRWGTRGFTDAFPDDGWVCSNDRVCNRRAARPAPSDPHEEGLDVVMEQAEALAALAHLRGSRRMLLSPLDVLAVVREVQRLRAELARYRSVGWAHPTELALTLTRVGASRVRMASPTIRPTGDYPPGAVEVYVRESEPGGEG